MELRLRASIVLVALASLSTSGMSQVSQDWARVHDGAPMQSDFGTAVALDASGNAFVTGRSFGLTTGIPPLPPTQDIETVGWNPAGTVLWSRRYSSPLGSDDQAYAIAVSPQGDVYVAGQSAGNVGATYVTQQTVIKYAPDGTELWARQYGNTAGPNVVRSILVDAQGFVFVGGQEGVSSTGGDMCVRKLDSSGNVVWTATYDGPQNGNDYVYQIAFAPNGDVVAAGNTGGSATGLTDFAVMRVSAGGTVLWGREVDGTAHMSDTAFAVAVDAGGNAYAGGYLTAQGQGQNAALLGWDASGTPITPSLDLDGGANGNDALRGVAIDAYGRVVVMGGLLSLGSGNDFFVAAYSPSGSSSSWERIIDGPAHLSDVARGLRVDSIGNIYVSGYRASSIVPTTDNDGVVIELDPNGDTRFEHVHAPSTLIQQFVDLALGADGTVVAAGYADNGGSNGYDYLVVRLTRTAIPYCFGDGSGTACPCGNAGVLPHAGCGSSLGLGGHLIDSGASDLSADTLVLAGDNMTLSSALYFQGTTMLGGGAGIVFGDGLRCAGGTIVRLATKQNVNGSSQYPSAGDLSVSQRGGVIAPGMRTYQVWYRNAAAFCTPSTFNLTNGLRVTWVP